MNPKSLIPVLAIAISTGFGYGLATFFNKAPSTTAETAASNAAQANAPTNFVCVQEGGQWKTFAESQNSNAVIRSKTPLFTWNSKEFGSNWTPDKRCREVTQRFNTTVANNGGKLANLDLTTGTVNDETVTCAVKSPSEICNDQNMLFTMSQHNEAKPQQTLAKLINISQGQSGIIIDETHPPGNISLESLIHLGAIERLHQW